MMEGRSTEYKKGLWSVEEDRILLDYIRAHGKGKWNRVAKASGLKRCGKSCRLRWMNYLCPNVKRGGFSEEEEDLIIRLHNLLGNRWSLIAGRIPGRTDNQVKNHWNIHLSKKLGVKKGKCKVGASSSSFSSEYKEHLGTKCSSNYAAPPGCNDRVEGQIVMEGGSSNALGIGGAQGQEISDCYEDDSFCWFFIDDPALYYANNLMELLDESLDFVWHGL